MAEKHAAERSVENTAESPGFFLEILTGKTVREGLKNAAAAGTREGDVTRLANWLRRHPDSPLATEVEGKSVWASGAAEGRMKALCLVSHRKSFSIRSVWLDRPRTLNDRVLWRS